MLLSLLGVATERRRALRIFGLRASNPDYDGTALDQIGRLLKHQGIAARARWRHWRTFDVARARLALGRWLAETRRATVVAFGAAHAGTRLRCRHVALLIGVSEDAILLLDPLGQAPERAMYNVRIGLSGRAEGSFYTVVRRLGLDVLEWSPNWTDSFPRHRGRESADHHGSSPSGGQRRCQ
jgi:hypothetical protein